MTCCFPHLLHGTGLGWGVCEDQSAQGAKNCAPQLGHREHSSRKPGLARLGWVRLGLGDELSEHIHRGRVVRGRVVRGRVVSGRFDVVSTTWLSGPRRLSSRH